MLVSLRRVIGLVVASGMFFVGLMAVLGYMTGMEHLARWTASGTTPMALNTGLLWMMAAVLFGMLFTNGDHKEIAELKARVKALEEARPFRQQAD